MSVKLHLSFIHKILRASEYTLEGETKDFQYYIKKGAKPVMIPLNEDLTEAFMIEIASVVGMPTGIVEFWFKVDSTD